MPKQVVTLNDFAGGLNNVTAPRDLSGKQLPVCKNFDPSSPGQLVTTLVGSKLYNNDSGSAATVGGVAVPGAVPTAGAELFVFNTDFKLDDSAAGTAENIVTRDSAGSIDIYDIHEGANGTWVKTLTDVGANFSAYSAEGDLFIGAPVGGVAPVSLIFVSRTHVDGVVIAEWIATTQDKTAPSAASTMDVWDLTYPDDGTSGEVAWAVAFNTDADTGTWNNDTSGGDSDYYEFGGSFVYKNGAESAIVLLGASNEDAAYTTVTNRSAKVGVWIEDTGTTRKLEYGAKLYTRLKGEGTWYLLAEMDYAKGIKGDGEDDFAAFSGHQPGTNQSPFTLNSDDGYFAQTSWIGSPPVLITYELANGFCASDMPTARKVNFKTSVVANSRAYVGNVIINGVGTFPDRLLKSPVFQYDTFTADSYIDVAPNDGDQIMALEAYADRILMFKEKVLYILNASKELEFLESEHRFAGVKIQGAITKTPFGVAWINNNGCYFYDGESVNLLQLGKIKDSDWSDNIEDNAIIGYDEINQQLIIVWDSSSSGGAGDYYVYSFSSGCWHQASALTQDANMSNFINTSESALVYIGGTTLGLFYTFGVPTATVSGGDVTTADIHFGNYESSKNICAVTVSYKNNDALPIEGRGNLGTWYTLTGGSTGAGDSVLANTSGNFTITKFDTTGVAAFQGIKTFQLRIFGTLDEALEIEDISITYRDLGVH